MQNLKWLGALGAAVGIVFLLFALLWTEWVQFFVGAGLLVAGAAVWRAFDGRWPLVSADKSA